ncbi:MAG: hypothetical protein EPO26_05180 [Chloroflexota bacterium]|nr:MAG: hypothetical protein EPO26_05180 [Chloroflexota bacterium]
MRAIIIGVLAAIAAGAVLWFLTDAASRSELTRQGYAVAGNGAFVFACIGIPIITAVGWAGFWIQFIRQRRRDYAVSAVPTVIGIIAVPISAILGLVLTNIIYPPYARDAFQARAGHATVLLDNGRVLVTGGTGNHGVLRTTRIRDADGRWISGPIMAIGRSGQAATALGDGRVLISGGCCAGTGAIGRDEILDSGATAFQLLDSGVGRKSHSAIRLADGRVFAVGGESPSGDVAAALLFDPSSRAWTPAERMLAPRESVAAALQGDGTVVVAGGFLPSEPRDAEVYDPKASRWRTTSGPGPITPGPSALSLPDGRTLWISRAGLRGDARAQIYDGGTDRWSEAPWPADLIDGFSLAGLRDGRVLIAGGVAVAIGVETPDTLQRTWLLDPTTLTIVAGPPMRQPRSLHTATTLRDGTVLVVAGFRKSGYLDDAEIYDPASNTWKDAGSLTLS